MPVVAYLTSQLGESDTPDLAITHSDNMANSIAWFRFLVMATRWAIMMPAFAYLVAIPESTGRPRSIADRAVMLGLCNVLVMCGPEISPHMRIEQRLAKAQSIPVLDLTDMGAVPPWNDYDLSRKEIARRADSLGL